MPSPKTIAVVASDEGLLSSLAFALEVEGYIPRCEPTWPPNLAEDPNLLCVIVDAETHRRDARVRDAVKALNVPLVFLSDDVSPVPSHPRMARLTKPFQGTELFRELRKLLG